MTKTEPAIVIRINADDSAHVDYHLQDGRIVHKVLSVADVINALKQSTDTKRMIKSGFLPGNCIAYSHNIENNDRYYVIEHEKRTADILYHNTEYINFPIPRLLYGITVSSSDKITKVRVAVVPENAELNEDTQTYFYPFSNVSGFAMCTGDNKLPVYKKASALKNLPYFLFGLPDNDDHYNENHNKLSLGHRDLMEHLKDKPPEYYYSDILIPSGKKLADFI